MDIAWTLSSGGFRSGKKFPKGSSGSAVADLLKLPEINLGSRTFDSNLVIHTDLRSSEYADTWRAGYALGRLLRLAVGDATLANIHVLELGAGCGFTGLVAAQLGAQVRPVRSRACTSSTCHLFSSAIFSQRSGRCRVLS